MRLIVAVIVAAYSKPAFTLPMRLIVAAYSKLAFTLPLLCQFESCRSLNNLKTNL